MKKKSTKPESEAQQFARKRNWAKAQILNMIGAMQNQIFDTLTPKEFQSMWSAFSELSHTLKGWDNRYEEAKNRHINDKERNERTR